MLFMWWDLNCNCCRCCCPNCRWCTGCCSRWCLFVHQIADRCCCSSSRMHILLCFWSCGICNESCGTFDLAPWYLTAIPGIDPKVQKKKKTRNQSLNQSKAESTIPNNNEKKIKLGGDWSSCQKSEKWISKQSMLSSSSSSSSFFFYCKCKEKRV